MQAKATHHHVRMGLEYQVKQSGGKLSQMRTAIGIPLRDESLRRNSIDHVRLLLALLVVVSHTWSVLGLGPEPVVDFSHGATNLGALAVLGFFGVSGFLITRSYITLSSPLRYLWHRVLRIMPGYWVCLLVCALIFGPIFALLQGVPLSAYFTGSDGPLQFVWHNAFLSLRQEGVAGLPRYLPWAGHLDVALWTLIHEFHCYLVVLALGIVGLLRRPSVAGVVLGVIAAILLVLAGVPRLLGLHGLGLVNAYLFGGDVRVVEMWASFFVGATMFVWRRYTFVGVLPGLAALGMVAIALGIPRHLPGAVASSLLIPYGLLAIGFSVKLPRPRMDLSYGTYVYAWPVQQFFAVIGADALGLIPYIGLVFATTLGIASISWMFVESRAMRLKDAPLPSLGLAWPARFAGRPLTRDRKSERTLAPSSAAEQIEVAVPTRHPSSQLD